jgi:hypothetical protein
MHYHQAVDNSPLWPAQFCWPDGFMRVFSRQAHLAMDFVTTPERVQLMASSAENFIRHFNVGRTFDMSGAVPRLGADVPRWFGESVAFWDHDTLITWTSNVVPWITQTGKLADVDPFIYTRCIQTIFPVDGRPKPLSPGATIEYTVPDMYGRPWAQIWERYFEKGMKRPDNESIFEFH